MVTDDIFYQHFMLMQQENRIYATWCKKHGISYLWMIVLDTLLRVEHIEPAMLADRLSIPRQSMTSLLDQLEKNGLIRREAHPADRRCTRLYLTEKGRETIDGILEKLSVHEQAVTEDISREEIATFNRIYAQIVEKLQKRLADES